mgnify:CR=1 FL=1
MSGISHFILKLFWLTIFILFSLLIATLVGSNTQQTTIQLWPIPGQLTIALWLPILLSFGAGLMIGGLLIWLKSIASYLAARQMRKHKITNAPVKSVIEDESHLLFYQTAERPALNSKKDKQTLSAFTQGS